MHDLHPPSGAASGRPCGPRAAASTSPPASGPRRAPNTPSGSSETDADILPMLKKARRRFPEQEAIYENVRLHLGGQMMFLRAYLERDRGEG